MWHGRRNCTRDGSTSVKRLPWCFFAFQGRRVIVPRLRRNALIPLKSRLGRPPRPV
jgi:hypothetical protein